MPLDRFDLCEGLLEDRLSRLNEVNRLNDALQEISWLIETADSDTFVHKAQLVLEANL